MSHFASRRTRLLICPELVENESLRGYVSRVSKHNGSSPLLQTMLSTLKATTDSIQEIAKLTGCSESILKEHGSLTRVSDVEHPGILFGSCILSADQIWVQRRMICPMCLSTNGVSICCWELRDYDVCHEHGCYLVGRCSGCDRVLSWTRTSSGTCSCGVRLATIKAEEASKNRGLICKLIADAMAESITRSNQRRSVSESLTPLNWLFIVSNFVLSILIPGFCQEHLGKIRAISSQASEELLLVILKDSEYYSHLCQFISLHTFRNQMPMARALRAGVFDNEMRDSFLPLYKTMPLHKHLFKIKADVLKERELNLQRTSMYVARAKTHRMESHNFQLQSASFI